MSFPGQKEIEKGIKSVFDFLGSWLPPPKTSGSGSSKIPQIQLRSPPMGTLATAEMFTRIAGVSGAVAVILGAYGAHVFRQKGTPELREAFETGSRYHLIHSVCCLQIYSLL